MTGASVAGEATLGGPPAARPPTDALVFAVFAGLVLACFAAFFLTQRLKHTPTAVQRFERTPTFAPASPRPTRRQERISFKLAHADEVTVTIVDSEDDTIATLVRDYPVARYKQLSLRWNGRRGTARRYERLTSASGHESILALTEGSLAPVGEYRVRVTLRKHGGEVLSPWSFSLERR